MKIAIDGPAGSGKSTIAKKIAQLMNLTYIDTGAMYRAVTFDMLENNISAEDEPKILARLDEIRLDFLDGHIHLNGRDLSVEIRTPLVTAHVSDYSKSAGVRTRMTHYQREIASHRSVIMDGRDIGTVVLPDADVKIFLTASVEERARRRLSDFEQQGHTTDLTTLIAEIQRRDHIDSTRELSPLKQAEDAIVVDTSTLTIEEVTKKILDLITEATHVSFD